VTRVVAYREHGCRCFYCVDAHNTARAYYRATAALVRAGDQVDEQLRARVRRAHRAALAVEAITAATVLPAAARGGCRPLESDRWPARA